MKLFDFNGWFGRGSPAPLKILSLSDRLLGLAEWDATAAHWNLSYLWQGVHGNYLIGTPLNVTTVKQVLSAKGGIKALFLPTVDPSQRNRCEQLFRFAGCYYIAKNRQDGWNLPGYAVEEVYHHDFQINPLAEAGSWRIKVTGADLLVPGTDEARQVCSRRQLICPGSYAGDEPADIANLQMSLEERYQSSQLSEQFEKDRILHFYHPWLPLISVFDDVEFERNDYEVISPGARQILTKCFLAAGGQQKGVNRFDWPQLRIRFPESPRSLSSHPLDSVEAKPGEILMVTPTQYWLYLLRAPMSKAKKREIAIALASSLPFNWPKVKSETLEQMPEPSDVEAIKQRQTECTQYFRSRKQKSIIGVPYKAP